MDKDRKLELARDLIGRSQEPAQAIMRESSPGMRNSYRVRSEVSNNESRRARVR